MTREVSRRPVRDFALGPVLLREAVGPVLVAALALIVISRLVESSWLDYLLYDADSLALPLLLHSLESGEPFQWVMTSQLFFFPELPLFFISSLFGQSTQGSLLVNSVVNALVLYALIRWITARLMRGRVRQLQVVVAFAATAVFLVICLTESGRDISDREALNSIAATYLLTTYYYGVVVAGLLCIALAMEATGGFRSDTVIRRRVAIGALALLTLVAAATTLSNPLFLLDFVAPFGCAVLLVWFLNRVSARRALALLTALGAGAALGYAARVPLSRFIAVDAGSYLHVERAGDAVSALLALAHGIRVSPGGPIEIAILGSLLLIAAVGVLYGVFAQVRPRLPIRIGDASFLLYAFVVLQLASILVGQVVTGSLVSRYLMPIPVFAVLAIVAVADSALLQAVARVLRSRLRGVRVLRPIGAALAVLLLAAGVAIGAPPVIAAAQDTEASADQRCLAQWLDGRQLAGVASFWSARPLTLYGGDVDLQQVNFDFTPQLWMTNLYGFEDKDFSYVVADRVPDWTRLARQYLGEPASVTSCETVDILDYSGTPGETTLNTIIDDFVVKAEDERGF